MINSSAPAARRQALARTVRVVVMVGLCAGGLGGCALADGAIAYDPVSAYIFLLLAIAAACYLVGEVGRAIRRVTRLFGTLIMIIARLIVFSILTGVILTIAACAAFT